MSSIRIVIFAKLPLAGFAKTRLIPALGAEGAARLAQQMLHHTVREALAAAVGTVELCVTPSPEEPEWRQQKLPHEVSWSCQGEGDLGDRLSRAAQRTIQSGESILLIGTDCPALNAKKIKEAAQALSHSDAVLIPATDGGYVLLGVNQFHEVLFNNIAWSTATVFDKTMVRIQQLEWTATVLPACHDIDEPSDLAYLPKAWRVREISREQV
ncbi:MAG TPA: TIGR04282 family arsenosugar biosynthesis glycosyltransferase [Agitococcus sp.]|nr:TIGR04282 family arsenosugar biosynthesis glycosyltransferase [Agitococcus sp.]